MAETASPFWNVCVSCLDLLCTDSSLKVKTYNGGAPVWPLSCLIGLHSWPVLMKHVFLTSTHLSNLDEITAELKSWER